MPILWPTTKKKSTLKNQQHAICKQVTSLRALHQQCHECGISCGISRARLFAALVALPLRLHYIWTSSPCQALLYDLTGKAVRWLESQFQLANRCQNSLKWEIYMLSQWSKVLLRLSRHPPCIKYFVNLPELGMESHQLPASLTVRTPDLTSCLQGEIKNALMFKKIS